MEVRRKSNLFKNLVTAVMMSMTVVLWAYLIGTFMEQRQSLSSGTLVGGAQNADASNSAPHERPLFANEPQVVNPKTLFVDQYRRFATRDQGFTERLENDGKFLIDNSF